MQAATSAALLRLPNRRHRNARPKAQSEMNTAHLRPKAFRHVPAIKPVDMPLMNLETPADVGSVFFFEKAFTIL